MDRLVVEGTVEAKSLSVTNLIVLPTGWLRGDIEAVDADVSGTIFGTLVAHRNLIVRASGRLRGRVQCQRLCVEPGGVLPDLPPAGTIEPLEPTSAPRLASSITTLTAGTATRTPSTTTRWLGR